MAASNDQMRDLIACECDPELKQAYAEMLELSLAHPDTRQWCTAWFIIDKECDVRIGDIEYKGLVADGVVEIGYGLLPEYWGRGYATEAVCAMVAWALCQPGIKRIEAETEANNIASQRVLAKCGFVPTGTNGAEGPRFVYQD